MSGRAARSLLLAASTVVAGCVMPFGGEPSSPELDAVRRDLRTSPMQRIRAHEACVDAAPQAVTACMQDKGYHLIKPAEDPRAGDCQQLVDSGDEAPPAYCFAADSTPRPD
jgi:hypothetical protein